MELHRWQFVPCNNVLMKEIEGQVSVQALICLYNHHRGHSSNENEHEYQSSEYDDARPS